MITSPASEPEARDRLLRSLMDAAALLFDAMVIATRPGLTKQDFDAISRLCGESRNVPLSIALHDLAAFHFPPEY